MIIEKDVSLKEYTTLGCGGRACFFALVENVSELKEALAFAKDKKIPFISLGKGSNTLFADKGYHGLVILNKIHYIQNTDNKFLVSSGYSFSLLGAQSSKLGYKGLEFAAGIPASVGGAVYMNAGANGCETKDCLTKVSVIDHQGSLKTYSRDELTFSYRYSSFQKMAAVIFEAEFELESCRQARKRQLEILSHRTQTQPYSCKSAGCFFKNPIGISAGALIDKCGLKGLCVGDAEVSKLHANFIVNKGLASSEEILSLAHLVRQKVLDQTGISLEMEVKQVPYNEVAL